ncbi:MAG: F0F1 ATP synthase subunit B [Clostridia bacterium]|nr:F0F1 ATP synthase subunit B [Clostridia bacterium]
MNLLFLSEEATRGVVDLTDVWSLVFTWCNLLILYIVLKKFFFNKINDMLEKRKTEVEDTYRRADEAEAEANAIKEQYDAKMAGAQAEAEEIVSNAVKAARTKENTIVSEAKAKAAATIAGAEAKIEIDRQKAINEVKEDISSMAVEIASKVIERDIGPEDHERLIDKLIDELSADNDVHGEVKA